MIRIKPCTAALVQSVHKLSAVHIGMQKKRTWALVADGARAHILTGIDDPEGGNCTEYMQSHKKAGDLGSDRPGRTHASADTHRSALEPPSDVVRENERAFAAELVKTLDNSIENDQFDALVVVAESRTLGHLRKLFSAPLKKHIVLEAAKDLTGLPDKALREAITALLSAARKPFVH